jgi:hypothetical protein
MAHAACLVCFISTVNGHGKKKRKNVALVADTYQTLKQSIFSFNIYA